MPTPCSAAHTPLTLPVHVSLGAYGKLSHENAIAHALAHPPSEPLLGRLSTAHLQLCPQNRGQVDAHLAALLRKNHPDVSFRLHANVQVTDTPRIVDLCDWPHEKAWFAQIANVSAALQAPAYIAHAGKRERASVVDVLNHVREVEQLFGIPVGIEGHYSTPRNTWLIHSWEEYRQLLDSGVHYALDLSHLNILAVRSRRIEWSLVQEMLASENCLEVHVSGNDGSADQHLPLETPPWWFPLLADIHAHAVIFSEGRQTHFPSAGPPHSCLTEARHTLPSPA